MGRRWLGVWVCLAILFVLGGAVAFLGRGPKDLITRDQFDQIQVGMRRSEVEALLGGPCGDYTGGRFRSKEVYYFTHGESALVWTGYEGAICVWVAEGQVIAKRFGTVVPAK
jgi:hypothetical protein